MLCASPREAWPFLNGVGGGVDTEWDRQEAGDTGREAGCGELWLVYKINEKMLMK